MKIFRDISLIIRNIRLQGWSTSLTQYILNLKNLLDHFLKPIFKILLRQKYKIFYETPSQFFLFELLFLKGPGTAILVATVAGCLLVLQPHQSANTLLPGALIANKLNSIPFNPADSVIYDTTPCSISNSSICSLEPPEATRALTWKRYIKSLERLPGKYHYLFIL